MARNANRSQFGKRIWGRYFSKLLSNIQRSVAQDLVAEVLRIAQTKHGLVFLVARVHLPHEPNDMLIGDKTAVAIGKAHPADGRFDLSGNYLGIQLFDLGLQTLQ